LTWPQTKISALKDGLEKLTKCWLTLKAVFFGNLLRRYAVNMKRLQRSVVRQAFIEEALKRQSSSVGGHLNLATALLLNKRYQQGISKVSAFQRKFGRGWISWEDLTYKLFGLSFQLFLSWD
jgi:hypothetical protein